MLQNSDLVIKQFDYNSDLYKAELKLRNEVLRIPLGLSLYDEDLSNENLQWHIGAFLQSELVGVLLLVPLGNNVIKMRQVAVNFSFQGMQIGSKLVLFAENLAVLHGYKLMILHARQSAAPFYQKLGYEIVSDVFTEVTIPHFKMQKSLGNKG
jgi:predicted GNAT family N-acyltransferase